MKIWINLLKENGEILQYIPKIKKEVSKVISNEKVGGEIGITLGDSRLLRKINRTYRKKDKITDVLSFNLGNDREIMGDIYISIGRAKEQSRLYNVTLLDELIRLAVHGTLHVLGYTHKEMRENGY